MTKEERNQLIYKNKYLAEILAKKQILSLPTYSDNMIKDDIISSAYLGLVDAAKRYNPKKKSSFKTYAAFRIKGSLAS